MSDYMFMLESHLGAEQNRVVAEVQAAATAADARVYLVGGAMRDMLGGFPIRDLDFALEGAALKVAKAAAQDAGAQIVSVDEHRKSVELIFPGGVTAEIGMARTEKFSRSGSRPQVAAASIHEDLRRRDFSVNAIALSLNRASRGLLLDPTNGLADIHNRELRTLHNYSFYDEPVRMLRLVRFRVRLGFAVVDRTQQQFENAKLADAHQSIAPRAKFQEIHSIANEPNPSEVLKALEQEKLLGEIFPPLSVGKVDLAALSKFEKSAHLLEASAVRGDWFGPFAYALTQKMTAKDKAALIKATEMSKQEVELWQKLELRTRKLETELKSDKLRRPSAVYQLLSKASPDELLFVLYHSANRTAQDRVRNYLQKYLPIVQEVTQAELDAIEGTPGTPKYEKAKQAMLAERLNRRPKKVEEPPPPPPPPEPPPRGRGRGTIGGLGMRG